MDDPRRRFAVKLADRLGYLHVDDMLERMSPEEFDERWAADNLDLEAWEIGAMIAAQVANAATQQILSRAGRTMQQQDVLRARDLVPWPHWVQEKHDEGRYLSDEQTEAELRKMI